MPSSKGPALAIALMALAVGGLPAAAASPKPTAQYSPDQAFVRFRAAASAVGLEVFQARHSVISELYVGLSYSEGEGWYLFRIDDGMPATIVRELMLEDPAVCRAELVGLGEVDAVGIEEPGGPLPCVPLPSSPRLDPLPTATASPTATALAAGTAAPATAPPTPPATAEGATEPPSAGATALNSLAPGVVAVATAFLILALTGVGLARRRR